MKQLIYILLCSLIYLSIYNCSGKREYFSPEQFYSLRDTIKCEIISPPLSFYCPIYYSEYGLLASTNVDNKLFQLLDSTNSALLTSTGKKGRGPDEFLMALPMEYDYSTNQFSVFDFYRQEMVTYLVSPYTISLIRSVNLKKKLYRVKYLNDSLMVCVNFYPHQKISLINTNAQVLYEEPHTILGDDRIQTTNGYYDVMLDISPDKKYTVIADGDFTSVKVFINKPDTLELKWKKILLEPKYNFNPQKNWYMLRDENYFGFRGLYLTNEYIYLSCDDNQMINVRQKMPNLRHTYILVMDYDGNIVHKYLLDKFIVCFTLSPDRKSLYAMIDTPDFLIAKYSL